MNAKVCKPADPLNMDVSTRVASRSHSDAMPTWIDISNMCIEAPRTASTATTRDAYGLRAHHPPGKMSVPIRHSPAGTTTKRTCATTIRSPFPSEAAEKTASSLTAEPFHRRGGDAPSVSGETVSTMVRATSAAIARSRLRWPSLKSGRGDTRASDQGKRGGVVD